MATVSIIRLAQAALLTTLVLGASRITPSIAASSAPEYNVKAGYVLLFTRYVEWPKSAFSDATATLVICVLGNDPFGNVLDDTVAGLRSQGRPLSVRRVDSAAAADVCHLAFIGASDDGSRRSWLAALASRPVLTIVDSRAALEEGAVLAFVIEDYRGAARVRFDASLPAMERAGLKISAQMLVSARKVHRGAPDA